jgi:hypothetical protein
MGWKASMLIIHQPTKIDQEQLLQELGFDRLKNISNEQFSDVMKQVFKTDNLPSAPKNSTVGYATISQKQI